MSCRKKSKMKHLRNKILALGIICFLIISSKVLADFHDDVYSPLEINIKLEKETFRIGEEIKGEVNVYNSYPGSLPVIFVTHIFHDDQFFWETLTSLQSIPMGRMSFTLKTFGVPFFNAKAGSEGTWRIKIFQKNMEDKNSAEVTLKIVPPAMRAKKIQGFSPADNFTKKKRPF